jgi:hypothetical protein
MALKPWASTSALRIWPRYGAKPVMALPPVKMTFSQPKLRKTTGALSVPESAGVSLSESVRA